MFETRKTLNFRKGGFDMKKKLWIPILAAILVVCAAAAVVLTQINTQPDDTTTTPPHAGTLPPSTDGATINDATLVALLQEAETMINASPTVTLKNDYFYIMNCLRFNNIQLQEGSSLQDATVTVVVDAPNQQRDLVRYVVFLSLLLERHSNCYANTDRVATFNRPDFYILFLCDKSYASGYNTVQDYYKDIWNKTCPPPEKAYRISGIELKITRYEDPTATNIYAELLEQAF